MRNALYMPALVAIRHNLHLAETYRTLVDAGKPAKLAIAAIMRKLVILACAFRHIWSGVPATSGQRFR